MNVYKILVTGAFNAGKTEFVRTLSDIPIVSTEQMITDSSARVKSETTVAMDYGQMRLNGSLLHLYGTPGQPRFDFMWNILSQGIHAFVVMVDSTDRASFPHAKRLIRNFQRKSQRPYVVAANKRDLDAALALPRIKKALAVDDEVSFIPCVASDKASAYRVLKELLNLLA
jgi:hypothetical protein